MPKSSRCFSILLISLWVAGCAVYAQQEPGKRCTTNKDCNTTIDCGVMVACVDGKCDASQTFIEPCSDGCQADSDCVMTSRTCCCGEFYEDYFAIVVDHLAEWLSREECAGTICTDEECAIPQAVETKCLDGKCQLQADQASFDSCMNDQECTHVPIACPSCDCHAGYIEKTINKFFEKTYLADLEQACRLVGACAPGPFNAEACTNRPGICVSGKCQVLSQDCDCPFDWNPVCISYQGQQITVPNRCHANCLNSEWSYAGRCECEAACRDPDPVCASNGITYWCGVEEALCSGHAIAYTGDCDAACDHCAELDRPPRPVCSEDFIDYVDVCYADCHQVDWWHTGACLPYEGDDCDNGWDKVECPRDDLYCFNLDYCSDCPGCSCPGFCIALGHCLIAQDCHSQPLPTLDCAGFWTCQEHVCTWICD
ncbi:MAG: hypothetical protein JRJ87_21145 [Deltaproteobacteria bacterium]|nr:hypothetical protein [Deltaproteobacteria bacterium]